MKKKSYIQQRYSFKKNEKKRLVLKTIINNLRIKKNLRWKAQQLNLSNTNINSKCRIKNICIFTNRTRGIYRLFKISRIKLKEYISNGLIPGFQKYSW